MHVENITSNDMNLNIVGKDMQIEVYEKVIKNLQQKVEQLENIINEAIRYMKSIENEPDADMYMKMGEYNEYKYLLSILKKGDKNE